ncbi:HPr kinase/phosphatase C-terminal domain-containing protein [Methylobacterium sp. J-001]|uniref:HPr kinase/phosphorylase n=1 Tax=Methylobacterium sp. J-001 TaxID=2836609 RepID=UPI001FBB6571|nr:HPr kinase/phosphatase C-terminal domain-containing protein [Methylobacterium sp. J-001]MCJ2120925.1 HPr kinase/phosphatase C-terminal domain-containing protein [Methylobacterium sp. J-001]
MSTIHAACIALGDAGILIRGPSGSGKSSLAVLLASEADGAFVADDRVLCDRRGDLLSARAQEALCGQVEIRGQGILSVADLGLAIRPEAIVRLTIDLAAESPRLPEPPADAEILGLSIPRLILDRGVRRAGLAPLLIRAALRKQRP